MNIQQVLRSNGLTNEQFNAAMDTANEVLCLACAGSGKSTTLAYRIVRLIAQGEMPEGIVAFTFTEKAAESIKRRVTQALQKAGLSPSILGAMYIGTIHSYCKYLLGEMDAKYRQYEVLDPNRLKLYLISRYSRLGLQNVRNQRTQIRVQSNPQAGPQRYFETIEKVADAWSTLNDEVLRISDVVQVNSELGNVLQSIYDGLNREQFIDYSLMIRLIVDALNDNDQRINRAVGTIKHLMVDEYQDVNPAQEFLIAGIHQRTGSLFVVGDDDQAVYSWRGADVSNILNFQTRYPNCSPHTLSTNFRSTSTIVEASSGFVNRQLGSQRILKTPIAFPNNNTFANQAGKFFFVTRLEEAEWIANRIQSMLGMTYQEGNQTRGLCPSDFAILMKSTNSEEQNGSLRHSAYTRALENLGIAFHIENLGSIFNFNCVNVLHAAFEKLRDNNLNRQSLQDFFNLEVLPVFPHADFSKVSVILTNWQREIHQPIATGARRKVSPQQLLHQLLNAFGVSNSSFNDLEMHAMGMFSKIMQDIESVYISVDSTSRFTEILNFIGNVANGSYETSQDVIIQRPNAVFISTIHSAKGLEFPVVFVVDVQAGRFPGSRSSYQGWLPQTLLQNAINRGAYINNREGEIRLFYTAVTRAERFLYVTGCENLPGGKKRNSRSVFSNDFLHQNVTEDTLAFPSTISRSPQIQRIDENIMPTSFSEIRYYLTCPKNYQFRKQYGFNPYVPDLYGYGQTVHTSIAKLHELFPKRTPTPDEAELITRDTFHLKHVPPARNPLTNPGPYERALEKAVEVVKQYVSDYGDEFTSERQVEVRFEVPANQALITGSIDLLVKEDASGNITDAKVVDFKSLEKPDESEALDWTELSVQVQLYAKAANEVLGQNAQTGAVHLLRSNERINVPIDTQSINAAIQNIEWAVDRIMNRDFPMRAHPEKCENCDFHLLCSKNNQSFASSLTPPPINLPESITPNVAQVKAFSQC